MPDRQLCFRCIENGKCQLFDMWSELVDLWGKANRQLSVNRDSAPNEVEEVQALEEKASIANEYYKLKNKLKQEAIERGCGTVLEKMG